jgi:hypothetical protein
MCCSTVFFAAAGIYVLIGRFFQDAWRRGRLVYGLTSKRILIVAPSRQTSLDLAGIGEMQLQQKSNGTGSIVFGPDIGMFSPRGTGTLTGAPAVPTFEMIGEVAQVYAAIRDAQKKARAS